MKAFIPEFLAFAQTGSAKRNLRLVFILLGVFAAFVATYSVLFHYLMAWEYRHDEQSREYSWITGVYWTLTVMSTLGFGDITFHTDLGMAFSIVVLLTGTAFMLVILPFTFIQFFFVPWIESREAARAPRRLPEATRDHVILTYFDSVAESLITRLRQFNHAYVVMVPDTEEALRISDLGYQVMVGPLDDPATYERAQIRHAGLVVATDTDPVNTNVAMTVRQVSEQVRVVSVANDPASVDILELAGSTHVLQLKQMLGQSLARRAIGGDALAHVIGKLDEICLAEANAYRTPLVGKTLRENRLHDLGVTVVGIWERGRFGPALPDTMITSESVLVLAGAQEHLDNYNEHFAIYNVSADRSLIIGGGRIGRAAARALHERQVDFRIVDKLKPPAAFPLTDRYIIGDAAEREILDEAGIATAPNVIITTHDDSTNIYLTVYCRKLNPGAHIVSRATLERNVGTLHRAGADAVTSYASLGANTIFNLLERSDILTVSEGLDILRLKIPPVLVGKTLVESRIRAETGCSVIGISQNGTTQVDPDPQTPLPANVELILIGPVESEQKFLEVFRER